MRKVAKAVWYTGTTIGAVVVVVVSAAVLTLLGRRKAPPPLEVVFEDGYYPADPGQDVDGDE